MLVLFQFHRGANEVEMVRTREDMLQVEECEEEGWCPLARLEEHNLEWVIQVNFISYKKRASV